jgi:hypothetical protein
VSLGECENGAAVVEKLAREHGCLGRVSTLPANGIALYQCSGSMTVWCGSGSGSADPCL